MPKRFAFIWLTKGQKPQRDVIYDFKGKKLTGEVLDKLNYQFMRRLKKEGLIILKELYIDRTKIEKYEEKRAESGLVGSVPRKIQTRDFCALK